MSLVMRVMSAPGLLAGEEVERQPLEVREDPHAQLVHEPLAEPAR